MRVLLATDAWFPQVNGVVRTLSTTVGELQSMGHEVRVVHPGLFRTVACPTYPEIRLALLPGRCMARAVDGFAPDAVHIATEGPLGMAARRLCLARGLPFTTSFHTLFPDYLAARFAVPRAWTWAWLRRFHAPAVRVMSNTPSMDRALAAHGIAHTARWSRGVDIDLFHPRSPEEAPAEMAGLPRPVHLYVGRLAVEKNIAAFLDLALPGSKVVVGDGPQRAALERRHADAVFLGMRHGEALARAYAAADVLVMPSRTETFGIVMLEALACGVPVAAYPVTGPRDVIADSGAGALDDDLGRAVARALTIPRESCLALAARYTWRAAAQAFLGNLAPRDTRPLPAGLGERARTVPAGS
ncbi:MAG: glycosyltransferase family 4 protein [Alphaproteobacteria bacterium]